ncbi:MAG: hypothetical protein QM722_15675 [Piscinibacter sp.]
MKPARDAQRLQAMVQARLIAHPAARQRFAGDPRSAPQAGAVIGHERDMLGRNWTILDIERGEGLARPFRAIVDALRLEFDLS